jgi:hypothetical protein
VLNLTSTQSIDATLTATGWNATLELRTGAVCPGATSTACVATSPYHIAHILPAGTYYLVVKGTSVTPNAGAYTLTVTQTPSSLPGYAVSTAPTGVHWIDACAASGSTTLLSNVDDGVSASQTIPFTFQYYGASYTTLLPSADGYVVFGTGTNASSYGTYPIPDPSRPRPAAFIYGRDLYQRATGVCVATVGTAPNRQYVIETNNAYHFLDTATMLTFEAILSEGTNTIDFVYNALSGPGTTGEMALVGLQNDDGTLGTTFELSMAGSLMPGLVVRFTPTH